PAPVSGPRGISQPSRCPARPPGPAPRRPATGAAWPFAPPREFRYTPTVQKGLAPRPLQPAPAAGRLPRTAPRKHDTALRREGAAPSDGGVSASPAAACQTQELLLGDCRIFTIGNGAEEVAAAIEQDDGGGVIHGIFPILEIDAPCVDAEILEHRRHL